MCGIAGFYSTAGVPGEAVLRQMTDSLQHRGPDASGYYYNDTIGLGHRRLSIIDLSDSANQPMTSASGRYVMIFNGEVYNFKEIARQLDAELRTTGDSEVILEAYAQWGAACLERLNGMFTFVIYDKQDDSLFMARDRIGIKPLYYYYDDGLLLFASELKALVQAPQLRDKLQINKEALNLYLYLGYIPQPHSIYQGIYKFPKGHHATVSAKGMQLQPYWTLEEQVRPEVLSDEAKAKEQLKELVSSSVRYRLVSDVPFGTFLSGGIDSSLVTAVAQNVSDKPVNTFTIRFTDSQFNEADHARAVAKHLGTDHHELTATQAEAIELFDDIIDVYDEPFADSSSVPTMLVSKLARQQVTMTLSGDGGDETYMGYGFYNWAQRLNNPFVKALRHPISAALRMGDSRFKRAALMFTYPDRQRFKSHIFSQEQYCFREKELQQLLKPEWQQPFQLDEQYDDLSRKLTVTEGQALFDMKYYLPDDLLVKVDRASMRYSLESRVPLLDHRLVSFALNVHPDLKLKGKDYKYLLKQVLYDYVPQEYFNRPKWGFGMPLMRWLKGDLKHFIDEYLSPDVLQKCGLVEPQVVNNLIKQYLAGKDYFYNRLWLLIILHRWYLKNFN